MSKRKHESGVIPCRFCGTTPRISEFIYRDGGCDSVMWVYVQCRNNNCSAKESACVGYDLSDAIDKWNAENKTDEEV